MQYHKQINLKHENFLKTWKRFTTRHFQEKEHHQLTNIVGFSGGLLAEKKKGEKPYLTL